MSTNTDIVWRIAEFIDPNPITFCKLAMVNRDFNLVFTSDALWRRINPYGATENIIDTFYNACNQTPAEYGLLSLFWYRTSPWDPRQVRKFTQNRYAWLGYLVFCCTKENWDGFERYPSLIKSVLDVDPCQFIWTSHALRERYEYCLHAVKREPSNFRHVPDDFKDDMVLFESAVGQGFIEALEYRGEGISGYETQVKNSIEQNPASIAWLTYSDCKLLFADRELMLKVVKEYPFALIDNPQYADDFEVNLAAVTAKRSSPMLGHLSSRFQDNYELVLQAVKSNGTNIAHASKRLRKQHCIKLAAIKNWYPSFPPNRILKIFELFDREELADPDIVKALVSHHGLMLGEVSGKNNPEVVMLAVTNNGKSIAHASDELKHDRSIALAAVSQCAFAYQYIAADLRDEREILEAMVKQDGTSLRIIPSEMHDRALVKLAVESTAHALKFAGIFKDDKEIVEIAIRSWYPAYTYATSRLQHDKDVVYAAFLAHNGDQLEIPAELLADWVFMEPIVRRHGTRLPSLLDNKEFALLSVAVNSKYYRDLPKKYQQSLGFNIEAVKRNGRVFNELDIQFCCERQVQEVIR